jgi:hypothetical protein
MSPMAAMNVAELDRQRLNHARYDEPDHAIPEEATAA